MERKKGKRKSGERGTSEASSLTKEDAKRASSVQNLKIKSVAFLFKPQKTITFPGL